MCIHILITVVESYRPHAPALLRGGVLPVVVAWTNDARFRYGDREPGPRVVGAQLNWLMIGEGSPPVSCA